MTQTRSILWLAASLLFAPGPAPAVELPQKPNVLFLFSDDQRFDTIHALGNDPIKTPNLDKLVENGFTLTHTYCMGSMQPAVCVDRKSVV